MDHPKDYSVFGLGVSRYMFIYIPIYVYVYPRFSLRSCTKRWVSPVFLIDGASVQKKNLPLGRGNYINSMEFPIEVWDFSPPTIFETSFLGNSKNDDRLSNRSYMCQGLNSHYFHIIGDKLINPIVGVYIPTTRIPVKGGMTIPNIATFDHGTYRY